MEGTREQYEKIIRELLEEYAQIPYLQESLVDETIFDRESGRYLLVTRGWQNGKSVNSIILHLALFGEKVSIQCNNTDQDIVDELIQRGVSSDDIVFPDARMPDEDVSNPSVDEFALA